MSSPTVCSITAKCAKLEEVAGKLSKENKDATTKIAEISAKEQPKASSSKLSGNKSKSSFLSKPRMLYVGDSVANNIDPRTIENKTGLRLRTVKVYSSTEDKRVKWPCKHVQEVTNKIC